MDSNNNKNANLRLRSHDSVKGDGNNTEEMEENIVLDDPCHKVQDSLLITVSENYRGILNLFFILLVFNQGYVTLANIIKYGILIDPLQWLQWFKVLIENPLHRANFYLLIASNIFIIIGLLIERACSVKGRMEESTFTKLVIANIAVLLMSPIIMIRFFPTTTPLIHTLILMFYSAVSLKLISYHSVNYWCRTKTRYGKPITQSNKAASSTDTNNNINNNKNELVTYPNNLNVIDIYYFMFAPTLCYQLNFPRTERIRKTFLLIRLAESAVLTSQSLYLLQQWIIPAVANSNNQLHFKDMEYSRMIERLLKLAVPYKILLLIGFYSYFNSTLNLVAEVMRFGDRNFYNDWWNCQSFRDFWSRWNIPVHRWCVRHLFKPIVHRGYSSFQASLVVFFVSGLYHEYFISGSLKTFKVSFIILMLSQVPLIFNMPKLLKGNFGNIAVWLLLIIEMQIIDLLYYHDYYMSNVINP